MTPVKNIIPGFEIPVVEIAKNQDEYITLPSWISPDGMVVNRWRLSWKERLKIFLTGNLWHSTLTFHRQLQPFKMDVSCPIMGHTGYDKEI
jgi:hypothetical protein